MKKIELTKSAQDYVYSHISSKRDALCECKEPELKVSPEILTLYAKSDEALSLPADFVVTVCSYCGKTEFYPMSLFRLETFEISNS